MLPETEGPNRFAPWAGGVSPGRWIAGLDGGVNMAWTACAATWSPRPVASPSRIESPLVHIGIDMGPQADG
jgi:hypothetical protein